jgi:hypothetical protein
MIPALVERRSLRFPGHEITWAGECPWTGGLCFGSEDGVLLFPGIQPENPDRVGTIKASGEAVNGAAIWREYVGVSTRGDVNLYRRGPAPAAISPVASIPNGAHGIVATAAGRFYAPMGPTGLWRLDAGRIEAGNYTIDRALDAVNFYRVFPLESSAEVDLLACAARASGLLAISSKENRSEVRGLVSPGMDFIDVCSIATAESPRAVAGLSLDGSVVLLRDILAPAPPKTFPLAGLRGTPYSVLSGGGLLFILSSEELVAFPDLIAWYVDDEPHDRPFRYRSTPIRAVDAFVASGKHLILVLDDEILLSEIRGLVDDFGANGHGDRFAWSEGERMPDVVHPKWDRPDLVLHPA